MAKVTYLDNCGFIVKTNNIIMVFDYWRDPTHSLTKILKDSPELPVVFFVSCNKEGHYTTDIFNLAQDHKRTYVVANEVLSHTGNTEEPLADMSAGDRIEDVQNLLTVEAFGDGDKGVSFLVTTKDGNTVFHGGHLSPQHADVKDGREGARLADEFTTIVRRIATEVSDINLAFLEVDPAWGDDFARGAVEFVETVKVDNFIPMHTQVKVDEAGDFRRYHVSTDNATRFHCPQNVGQTLRIELKTPQHA